jgi:hypothetical protein
MNDFARVERDAAIERAVVSKSVEGLIELILG